jgi:hypothetical protein
MVAAIDGMTRWTVMVSKATDISLRSFLARHGMKKGDLSKFIDEAVMCRLLELTLAETREKFAGLPADELQTKLDEAAISVRQHD